MTVMPIILQQIMYLYLSIKKYLRMLCFLGLVWSQEAYITGLIISDEDQTPIHGANIYLKKLGIGTVSQVNGRFVLENLPHGEISFTISMIGFKDINESLVLNKNNYDLGKISMSTDTIKIKEIVVDAHHELQPHSFASNIDFIGDKYHKNLKSSLALTLDKETGLSIRSMGQATAQPVLRGYTGDRFLLTENGITAGDLSNTSIDHAISMDMASYNKIRIIRGPEALLFGSNTIGGVIDVSRQFNFESRFKKISLSALLGAESSNKSLFGNFVAYFPVDFRQQFRFSILRRNAGNQNSPNGVLDNTALSNHEVTGTYSYFGRASRSIIILEEINMNYGIPGSYEGHIDGVDIKMNKKSQKYNYHKDIFFLGFQTLDMDQRFISYMHSEYEKGNIDPSVRMDQKIFSLQSKLTGNHLTVGSLLQYRDFKAGGFYWTPDAEEISLAIFGMLEKEIKDFTLQISSRAEFLTVIPETSLIYLSNLSNSQVVNRYYPIFAGAVGIYRSWENWKLSLGAMLTGRAPSIEDLYSDGPHLGTYAYEIGKPELDLENTIGVEASLEHSTEKSDIRFTGYHNFSPNYHISTKMGDGYEPGADWIEWGSGTSGWLYKYQMQGLRSRIYGLEFDFQYELLKLINLHGNLSVTRGENISDNKPLAYVPPDNLLFSTELDLKPFSVEMQLKKVLPQTRLGEFETKTSGYFIADLNGSFTIHKSQMTHKFIFQIDNIFDEVYYNHLSRIKLIMPEKGQSFSMQYRLVF